MRKLWFHVKISRIRNSEKSVKIWEFSYHSDFAWNQFTEDLQSIKKCHFEKLGGAKFWFFGNFSPEKSIKNAKNKDSQPIKLSQLAVFENLKSLNLVLRKIWMAE